MKHYPKMNRNSPILQVVKGLMGFFGLAIEHRIGDRQVDLFGSEHIDMAVVEDTIAPVFSVPRKVGMLFGDLWIDVPGVAVAEHEPGGRIGDLGQAVSGSGSIFFDPVELPFALLVVQAGAVAKIGGSFVVGISQ